METKELKIQVPEGYEIDKEKSTFEKIVFKKKDNKPRSWEEYCKLMKINKRTSYDILNDSSIHTGSWTHMNIPEQWRNSLPSKELTEAFLAMMQLMSLRQAWIGKWKPDWTTDIDKKWCIVFNNDKLYADFFVYNAIPLSFPTEEMAKDFMNTFKDLLEVAKPLI